MLINCADSSLLELCPDMARSAKPLISTGHHVAMENDGRNHTLLEEVSREVTERSGNGQDAARTYAMSVPDFAYQARRAIP